MNKTLVRTLVIGSLLFGGSQWARASKDLAARKLSGDHYRNVKKGDEL